MTKKSTPTTTTEEETVSRAPRMNYADKASFRNPNDLSFPKEMEAHFTSRGYNLRWVSVLDYKSRTFSNSRINYFLSLGGSLVTPSELKKVDPTFLTGLTKYAFREDFADDDSEARGDTFGIRKDDLVLMKIPAEFREQKARMNKEMVEEQLLSAERKQRDRGLDIKESKHGSAQVKIRDGFFGN